MYKTPTPTPYESPELFSLMTHLSDEICQAAADLNMVIPLTPMLGTLPTGRANAVAICLEPNDYIILFEHGLFGFANLLSKTVALAMPFKGTEDGRLAFDLGRSEISKEAVMRFGDVLLAYLFLGTPHRAQPYLPDASVSMLGGILRNSMELFVMGHEYGHIISGHFGNALPSSAVLAGIDVSEIVRNWRQEHEADAVGVSLMMAAMQKSGMDLAMSFWGADFFFSFIEIIERTISIMRTGREDEIRLDTHPPAKQRREALRSSLGRSAVPSLADAAEPAINLGSRLHDITEQLWQRTAPVVHKLRREGARLAPGWA
jgi:hypothetical protein